MTTKTAVLIKLQYPYGKKQVFLPTDINKVAARFERVGIETKIVDLNRTELPEDINSFDYVGIGVIGPPYVPDARTLLKKLRGNTKGKIILGGPVIEGLTPKQFRRIFGDDTFQVRGDADLFGVMPLEARLMSPVFDTPISERIERMSDEEARDYLSREISFFLSQGCKQACGFCAAKRTKRGTPVREEYSRTISQDLDALVIRARGLGIDELTVYLSPLDLFQTPESLREALRVFAQTSKDREMKFKLRGLSRIDSFLSALKREPELYDLIPDSGLDAVGFGVDGTTQASWRSQHKGSISLSAVEESFSECNNLGITPETLMVMGYHDEKGVPVDNKKSLEKNVYYSIKWAEKYGAVARPHVAKDFVPGNDGWSCPAWSKQRARLVHSPKLFRNLDYVALASELTHPNQEFRKEVNLAYIKIVRDLGPQGMCATNPLISYTGNRADDTAADLFNSYVPFDK